MAAPKTQRKKAQRPPVIDRVGAALGTTDDVTSQVTVPQTTNGTASPPPVTPVTSVTAAPSTAAATTAAPSTAAAAPATAAATAVAATTAPAANSVAATTGVDVTLVPVMTPPPDVTVPSVPSGFVPVPASSLAGYRPMQAELTNVPDAILELQSIPNWSLIFGMTAPAAPQAAERLSVAMQWTGLLVDSQDWFNYVKSQEGVAWKDALEVTDSLKAPFQLATAANPGLLKQYPALQRLLGAQKAVAKKAVATKKNNKAADAAAATEAAATAAPAAAPVVVAAAAAPAAATTTPARVVTVTG
jgi:hypothetical protein